MPQPRFQTGISDQFGAPGTYIKELAVSAPVRGLFRGITGITGECVRGPIGKFVLINSLQRFVDVYGGRDKGINGGAVAGKIWFALQNKQFGNLYVVRAAAAAAVAASFTAETAAGGGGTAVLTITASSVGSWGNDVGWKVVAASNGVSTSFNLLVQLYGKNYLYENLSINGTDDNTLQVVGTDDATPITLTKVASGRPNNSAPTIDGADANGYTKLGQTVSGYTAVAGTDGTIADTDFTGTGKAMEILSNSRGVDHCFVAGRSNTAIKTKILALSAIANNKLWLACPDSESISAATANTEAATLRDKHLVYCFNHPFVVDPVTGTIVVDEPHAYMASILSQTEPDVHPGVVDTAPLTQTIVRLQNELADADRDTFDANGVTYLNRDLDQSGNQVWLFGNGRTTDLTNNNSQIDGQRSKFFLIAGLAQRMRGDEKKPNTPKVRQARKAAFEGWLTELALGGRYVNIDETTKLPLIEVKNDAQVNAPSDVQAGIQRDLVRVQLIPKNLYLQLQIQIGVNVVSFTTT
jgi:hypothetical protein